MKIGVLALQGDFREHIEILKKLKATPVEIRKKEHLQDINGLIIPGGESTAILNLLKKYSLDKEIKKLKIPIFGSCAGAIILAKTVSNPSQNSLNLIDIEVQRNAYGSQLDSFETNLKVKNLNKPFHGIFIRAPVIKNTNGAKILAKYKKNPVLLKNKNILISTFHPELTNDTRIHKLFLDMVKLYK